MIDELVAKRRSIRRFEDKKIDLNVLKNIVKCGRLYPSRGNRQPLKFILVDNEQMCGKIFDNILWGSKVSGYRVFDDKEYSPKAYILVLIDKNITNAGYEYEMGASIQNMLLCATENQIGSVWIKSADMKKIKKLLEIEENNIEIDSLIALGYAKHTSKIIEMEDSYNTIIDDELNLNVPKRKERDIIFYNKYGN
jgi:oxygen-insensitive NAD(P)H nitroreductase